MHLLLGIITIIYVWIRKDYVRWRQFLPTMQYIAIGNLTYNFLCTRYLLWQLRPDFLTNHSTTELIYTFITFPGTALMFLVRYPFQGSLRRRGLYIGFWIAVYAVIELILVMRGNIIYSYGWNLGWSVAFDAVMFMMLALHHKRPLLAYVLSIPITVGLLWLFDVPVGVPIEYR
ncbi:CBO0543 family protein [Ectobacillus ponti]|uniref:Uncharacterized protein n=1 Tax=Ectobacillus ponti TaxID=2961894 RepID=A0AA42BPA3_9BACI|nr:hypothetical protein [Ectobacillus ponti]